MWHFGKTVRYVSSSVNSKFCHAIINGIPGQTDWLQIAPTSVDGVTNVLSILTSANANDRLVTVRIDSNKITGAFMS